MSQNIKKLKNQYLEYIEIERGRALKTVENYDRYLKKFFDFSKVKNPQDIKDETVRKYRLYLNREGLKKKTQNYYLIALRNFLKYLYLFYLKLLHQNQSKLFAKFLYFDSLLLK